MNTLVIVGTGLAGYNLAKEFRKLDAERPLVLITRDDGRNYSKPMLSNGFAKQKTADELAMHSPDEMAQQLKATVLVNTHVTRIDTAQRRVYTGEHDYTPYGDLVLAWGADTFKVPMEGDGVADVLSINDLVDYGVFREKIAGRRKVLVIGAGLIGSEFANDLANGGFQVEVVDPAGRCLPALLPPEASAAVARGLETLGVRFHFGPAVRAVNRHGAGYRCTLTTGEPVDADLVISAVGLRPRTALAKDAGLTVNRGIVVDRELRTSAPHVYAFGDCAEVNGYVLPYVLPLMAAARALAKTLAGTPTPVSYGVMPVVVKTPACPVVVCPPPLGAQGGWQVEANGQNVKALFVSADGKPLGFALTGEATHEKQALAKQMPVLF
ncbi:MAG: FAD-dependent oxidoreductase [Pseudomonadota bacterium]